MNNNFIEEGERACKKAATAYADLLAQQVSVKKRLSDEIEKLNILTRRKENLAATATESLSTSADTKSYEKYKTSLRKLGFEIDACKDAIATLEKSVLPQLEQKIRSTQANLTKSISEFCATKKPDIEAKRNKLLAEWLNLGRDYRQNCRDLFSKLGGKFSNIDPNLLLKTPPELQENLF